MDVECQNIWNQDQGAGIRDSRSDARCNRKSNRDRLGWWIFGLLRGSGVLEVAVMEFVCGVSIIVFLSTSRMCTFLRIMYFGDLLKNKGFVERDCMY